MVGIMKLRRAKQSQERQRIRPVDTERSKRVYSYYASGSQSPEHPVEREPRLHTSFTHKLRLLPAALALVVIVGSVLYSFTLGTMPTVATLRDQPSPYRETQDYANAAEALLGENIRNRTKFTVETYEVEQALLDAFPELQDAVLRLPVLGRTPTLVVEIRQPVLLLATAAKTYTLDANGIAVSEAKSISAEAKTGLPTIQDQSGVDVELGQQVLTQETVQFVLDALFLLKADSLAASGLTLPVSINELDIRVEGLPFYVKTDTSGDVREQIGSFLAVYEYLGEQGITPAEYIDVRVEEKVFYK